MEAVTTKSTFQKYPAYKDSGVEWLGVIPEHWKLLSNKNIFKLKKELVGKKSADYTLLSLTLKGIIQRDLDNGGKFPAEFDTYQEVKKGDFVFCLFDVEETPRCIGLSDFEGMITGAYTVMEVNPKFDQKFLYYFYLNLDTDKRLRPLYTGLRNTISKDNFFAFKTFIPLLEEQTAIAAFLDDKTAKIDRAIAQKEKMIALLKERKQIIIQDLVTGKKVWNEKQNAWTEPAEVKDSGVEWIGEIPEGWEVKKLKSFCKTYGRIGFRGYSTSDLVGKDEGAITISPSNIQGDFMNFEKCTYLSWTKYHESPEIQIFKNDVLIVKTGSTYGKVGIATNLETEATINPQLMVFKDVLIENEYFYEILNSRQIQIQINKEVIGSTIPTISENKILNMKAGVPPTDEIPKIMNFVKNVKTKFIKAIKLQEQQIEKLKELKSTLIDSAVTGKIRVPSIQGLKESKE